MARVRCTIVTTPKSGRFVQWGQPQHRYTGRTSREMPWFLLAPGFAGGGRRLASEPSGTDA